MLTSFQRFVRLLRLRAKYPGVQYFGAPPFLRWFGLFIREAKKGFHSEAGQDELVFTEFFQALTAPEFPRLFIDVGCNHPVLFSNSLFFERHAGFRVLAVDALPEIRDLWKAARPGAEFVECAVGEAEGEVTFEVKKGDRNDSMYSSVRGASAKRLEGSACEDRTVRVRRLADILGERGITEAGIVSMDIEGYEYQALQGIDFSRFQARVFIIENNDQLSLGNDRIRDFLIGRGYLFHSRILNSDDIFIHPRMVSPTASGRPPA